MQTAFINPEALEATLHILNEVSKELDRGASLLRFSRPAAMSSDEGEPSEIGCWETPLTRLMKNPKLKVTQNPDELAKFLNAVRTKQGH